MVPGLAPVEAEAKEDEGGGWGLEADDFSARSQLFLESEKDRR